jgi:adenylate kinase
MLYVITGVPGVGKTTLVNAFVKLTKWKLINYGDVLLDIAKKKKLAKTLDGIRKIPEKKYFSVQMEAARKIAKSRGKTILTTHVTVKTSEGYFPGFTPETLKILKPKVFVLIEADPKNIMKYRRKDKTRIRKDFGAGKQIKEHQMVNRVFAYAFSSICGADVLIFHQNYDKPERLAKRLELMLK